MSNNSDQNRDERDLDWLAFRYIADEMSADEALSFESQLAEDQQSREAVAGAVQLAQTVVAAEHLADSPAVASFARRANQWRRVAWMAIGGSVAACIMVALVWYAGRPGDSNPSDSNATAQGFPAASEALASAWIETLELDEQWRQEASETAFVPQPSAELLAVADDTPAATSSWMVAALAGLARDMSNELPPDGEREN